MANETTHELEVRRTFGAAPQKVYEAWTKAEVIARWFSPNDEMAVIAHELDVRPGGRYRIEMRHGNGTTYMVGGEYRELVPGRRLVFTWQWAKHEDEPETLVEIDLLPAGKGTELVLRHKLFTETADRDNHGVGWNGCLDRLVRALS